MALSFKKADDRAIIDILESKIFFIYDRKSKKTYLIKAEDAQLIIGMIFIIINQINQKEQFPTNSKIQSLLLEYEQARQHLEPGYTGIIEVAGCNKKSINQQHSNLSQYTFHKSYLLIKQG